MRIGFKLLIALVFVVAAMAAPTPVHAELVYNDCGTTVSGDHCCWAIYKLPVQGYDYCVLTYSDCSSGSTTSSNCVYAT